MTSTSGKYADAELAHPQGNTGRGRDGTTAELAALEPRNIAEVGAEAVLSVRPVKLAYEQVADQLCDLMTQGALRPGQRLPSESELVQLFGVGRSTIREALRALASRGLIITLRGVKGGSFATTPDVDQICRQLESSLGLMTGSSRLGIAELVEARLAIESQAAALAASRISEEQLDTLEKNLIESRTSSAHTLSFRLNRQFHLQILSATRNPIFEVAVSPIFDIVRTRFVRDAAPDRFWHMVCDDHEKILAALRGRRPATAETSMIAHLRRLNELYLLIDSAERREE